MKTLRFCHKHDIITAVNTLCLSILMLLLVFWGFFLFGFDAVRPSEQLWSCRDSNFT